MEELKNSGLRISLLIDSGLLIAGIAFATTMYADVQHLKEQRISETRIAVLEAEVRNLAAAVNKLEEAQRESTRQLLVALTGSKEARK